MIEPRKDEQPTATLRAEHRIIEKVLRVLEDQVARFEGDGTLNAPMLRRCVEFFRLFADACHHGKEEDLLFPVLERRGIPREGGPIGVMLDEHVRGREFVRQMGAALDGVDAGDQGAKEQFREAARQYLSLLTAHIHKEDDVLFNIGEHVMTDADRRELCDQFCEVSCRAFEGKRREQLESLADQLIAESSAPA